MKATPENPCSWVWLSGWALEPAASLEWVQAQFPQASHRWIEASPSFRSRMLEALEPPGVTRVLAYSLSSLLLLDSLGNPEGLDAHLPPVELLLVAPFRGFCKEAALGGKVPRSTLKWTRRLLKNRPEEALASFVSLSRVTLPTVKLQGSETLANLDWGLAQLETLEVPEVSLKSLHSRRIASARIIVGTEDALCDSSWWTSHPPEGVAVSICKGASHCLEQLAPAIA